jgi:hypothetical protein
MDWCHKVQDRDAVKMAMNLRIASTVGGRGVIEQLRDCYFVEKDSSPGS